MDDQPTGSCPCCSRRDPRQGYACGLDRSRMRSWLAEIPGLHVELLAEPLAREGGSSKGGPVSGSRERQLPIRVDVHDLLHARGWPETLDEDQVGHLSVLTTLRVWAADWADLRGMGEAGMPDVSGLCTWMRERVDEVADEHDGFPDAFHAVRRLRGALMAQLGQVDVPDYKRGVPCRNPQCGALTLVHHNGSSDVECESCPSLLSLEAFDEWVRHLAAAMRKTEKAA